MFKNQVLPLNQGNTVPLTRVGFLSNSLLVLILILPIPKSAEMNDLKYFQKRFLRIKMKNKFLDVSSAKGREYLRTLRVQDN